MQIPGMIDYTSGLAAKDNIEDSALSDAHSFVQKQFVDPKMETMAQNTAEKDGANFQDMPGFTEAQRAYNKAGDPIAASMLTTSMQSQANQYFLEAKQSGFPPGSTQMFKKKMQAWTDQTNNSQSPEMRQLTLEGNNKLTALYGRQIQAQQFKQQRTQSALALNNQRETMTSNSESLAHQIGSSSPESFTHFYIASQVSAEAQVKAGTMTIPQYNKAINDARDRIQSAQVMGDVNNMSTLLQSPNLLPAERSSAISILEKYSGKIISNPAFKGGNTYKLQRQANTLVSEALKSVHVNSAASNQELQNQIANARAGKPIDQNSWNNNLSNLSITQQNQSESNLESAKEENRTEQDAQANTVSENMGMSTSSFSDSEGVMPKDQARLLQSKRSIYSSIAKKMANDPQTINAHNQGLVSAQNQLISGLNSGDQQAVNMAMQNPGVGYGGLTTPSSINAINAIYNKRTALSKIQGGKGYFLTNSAASNMWASVSKLPISDQVQQINQMRHTLSPENFGTLENQIKNNAHVDSSAFISSYASTGNNPVINSNLKDTLQGMQNMSGPGKSAQNQNEIMAGITLSEENKNIQDVNKSANLEPTLTGIRSVMMASNRSNDYIGIRNIASNYYLNQIGKGNDDITAQNNTKLFLDSNWSINTKNNNSVLIPMHYIDKSGKSKETNLDNVHYIMNDMQANPQRYVDLNRTAKDNLTPIQAEAAANRLKVGLHWIGTSAGGFMLVDANGHRLLSKSGAAVGFTVNTADDQANKIKSLLEDEKKITDKKQDAREKSVDYVDSFFPIGEQ